MESKTTTGSDMQITVWDRFVRLFHWLTVTLVITGWLTGEFHKNEIHVLAGYLLALLVSLRLCWGFLSRGYARFSRFLYPPQQTLAYIRSMLQNQPDPYYGHNPAGALMVFALLGLLTGLVVTGLMLDATFEFEGPLMALNFTLTDEQAYLLKEIHEWLVNLILLCVVFHVLGVIVASIQHHENLVRAMITGKKPVNPEAMDAIDSQLKR